MIDSVYSSGHDFPTKHTQWEKDISNLPAKQARWWKKEEKIFLPAKQTDVKQVLNHMLFYNVAIYTFTDDLA